MEEKTQAGCRFNDDVGAADDDDDDDNDDNKGDNDDADVNEADSEADTKMGKASALGGETVRIEKRPVILNHISSVFCTSFLFISFS